VIGDAVDDDARPLDPDVAGEAPVHAVVLREVAERHRVGQVVDRDHLDVELVLPDGAQQVAADAAEAVDRDAGGHQTSS
jgi:hypothetical protein